MRYIDSTSDFDAVWQKTCKTISLERRLPAQVFRIPFCYFLFFDFDELYTRSFFGSLVSFVTSLSASELALTVVEPDPINYFYSNFGIYPALRMDIADSADDFVQAVQQDPGNSPADAIAFNSMRVVFLDEQGIWAIYAERELELAIAAFSDVDAQAKFVRAHGATRLYTADRAVAQLLPEEIDGEDRGKLHAQLIASYG